MYIFSYIDCPVFPVAGNTFTCHLPILSTFTKPESDSYIPILTNIEHGTYILNSSFDDADNSSESDMILFPGKLKFQQFILDGIDYIVAVYTPKSLEEAVKCLEEEDVYDVVADIMSENRITTEEMIDYLMAYHMRKVQAGYFSPEGSGRRVSFLEGGTSFKVDSTNDRSYYESMKSLPPFEEIHSPMSEFRGKHPKVKVYAQGCSLLKGEIKRPILLNAIPDVEAGYTMVITADARLLDLNFMWMVTKEKGENTYRIDNSDAEGLTYVTHNPGVLVAIGGFVSGKTIVFK